MSDPVAAAVEGLTDEGSRAFRASAIARRAHTGAIDSVSRRLMEMVRDGALRLRFDLVCPDDGRTIRSFTEKDALPIGEEVTSDRCASDEPFVVEERHIWVQFVPTEDFRIRVRQRRSQRSTERETTPDDDPPGLFRRKRIGWIRSGAGVT